MNKQNKRDDDAKKLASSLVKLVDVMGEVAAIHDKLLGTKWAVPCWKACKNQALEEVAEIGKERGVRGRGTAMRKTHPKWKSRVHRGRKRKTRNFERKRYSPNEDERA